MSILGLIDADPKAFNAEPDDGIVLYWFEDVKAELGDPFDVDLPSLEYQPCIADLIHKKEYRPSHTGDMSVTEYLYSRKALADFIARMDEAKTGKRSESGDDASDHVRRAGNPGR